MPYDAQLCSRLALLLPYIDITVTFLLKCVFFCHIVYPFSAHAERQNLLYSVLRLLLCQTVL